VRREMSGWVDEIMGEWEDGEEEKFQVPSSKWKVRNGGIEKY